MARIYNCNGLLYGVPTVHLSKLQRLQNSAAQLITHTPRYLHITLVLLALHWLPVKFRICYKIAVISFKAIHNLGPAYLSNLINIKRCSCSNLQSNVGVILQDPIAKFKCTLRDRDHLLQLLQRYGTVYWTTLGKRMILDMFKRLIKTHYFKEAYSALSWAIYGFYFLLLSSIFTSYLLWAKLPIRKEM